MICNLCRSEIAEPCQKNKHRVFSLCNRCELVSVPPQYWLNPEEEKRRYQKHNNTLENAGYTEYLGAIVSTVEHIGKTSPKILDFGCGERAVLTSLLNKNGYDCVAYDPVFEKEIPDRSSKFDIVVLCEVIEHLRDIPEELKLINTLLKNDGVLIIRTRLYPSFQGIEKWWYAQDKTHINFFSKKAIETTAAMINRNLVSQIDEDILIIS